MLICGLTASAGFHGSIRNTHRLQTFRVCNDGQVCLSQLTGAGSTPVLPYTVGLLAFGAGCPCPTSQSLGDVVRKLCGTLCYEPQFILLFLRPLAYIWSKLAFQANAL